jgi:hypothetical protein
MPGISWLAEKRLASQEVFWSMELVSKYVVVTQAQAFTYAVRWRLCQKTVLRYINTAILHAVVKASSYLPRPSHSLWRQMVERLQLLQDPLKFILIFFLLRLKTLKFSCVQQWIEAVRSRLCLTSCTSLFSIPTTLAAPSKPTPFSCKEGRYFTSTF